MRVVNVRPSRPRKSPQDPCPGVSDRDDTWRKSSTSCEKFTRSYSKPIRQKNRGTQNDTERERVRHIKWVVRNIDDTVTGQGRRDRAGAGARQDVDATVQRNKAGPSGRLGGERELRPLVETSRPRSSFSETLHNAPRLKAHVLSVPC